jgi:hypothetical protein
VGPLRSWLVLIGESCLVLLPWVSWPGPVVAQQGEKTATSREETGQTQTAEPVPAPRRPPAIIETLDPYKLFGSGNVPDGPYVPQNGKERFRSYLDNSFTSPVAVAMPFFSAIGKEFSKTPPEWHGFTGYAQRTGARAIFSVTSKTIETPISALLGYEQRYDPCYCSGTWHRIRHAILFQVLTVDHSGHTVVNFPRIFANYAGEMIGATPYPGPYDTWKYLRRGNGYFYWGWWYNIVGEFSPDLSRFLRHLWVKTAQSQDGGTATYITKED